MNINILQAETYGHFLSIKVKPIGRLLIKMQRGKSPANIIESFMQILD